MRHLHTSANRGSHSRFVLEAIVKALISKLSRSPILKTPNRLHLIHNFQPNLSLLEYLTCKHLFALNASLSDRYLKWYLILNKG